MSSAMLMFVAGGRQRHPVAGGPKPQIFLRSIVRSEISKAADETGVLVGYNFPHCVGFSTFFLYSDSNVA